MTSPRSTSSPTSTATTCRTSQASPTASNAAAQQNPGVAQDFGIALELQADCLAGAWASSIAGRELFSNDGEIEEALNAAEAVGDDRIQAQAGQRVDPDSFTHGTAEQRRHWFEVGYSTGDPGQCLTFDNALAP